MTNKTIVIGLVAALVIAIIGWFTPTGNTVVENVVERVQNVGALSGPDIYETIRFNLGLTTGGSATYTSASTTQTTLTLTSAEIDTDISYLEFNTGTSTTLTSMASSSYPFSDLAVGDGFSIDFYYATTTAASAITFAAGTGVDLQEDEGGTVIVNGLEMARLNFRKKANTDILMWVEVGQVAD